MELEVLQEITADILHVDRREVSEESTFLEDLGADSLDLFQIVSRVEEKYGIRIPDEKFRDIRSVGDLIRMIKEKTNR